MSEVRSPSSDKLSQGERDVRKFLKTYIPWLSNQDLEFLTTLFGGFPRRGLPVNTIKKYLKVSHQKKRWWTI